MYPQATSPWDGLLIFCYKNRVLEQNHYDELHQEWVRSLPERSLQQQQLTCLQAEVKELSSDNVKLYEKIRFLQGYQSSAGDTSRSRSAAIGMHNEGVETRYQNQYEQRLDPFRTFSNQERQRR